ncbi:MAG TPA: glutaredoxin family protein [Pyrinomonadaceae bacterium]|nr:glutaredoxin family protein [Pyrinomonadaceae bacterium]
MHKRQVTFYTRPGCHLCDEAKQAIKNAECEDEYTLKEVNIEDDRNLLHRYRYDIPVILIDDVEAFRHRLSPSDFRTAIRDRRDDRAS